MGNQATNHQYAVNRNWINAKGGPAVYHPPLAPLNYLDPQKQPLQQANHISYIKGQQKPKERTPASRIGSSHQPNQSTIATLRHSAIDTNNMQLPASNTNLLNHNPSFILKKPQLIRGSAINEPETSQLNTQDLPPCKLLYKPQICKSGSILLPLQKQKKPFNHNNFKLDTLTEQVDDIRTLFRKSQVKMLDTLIPAFQNDILEMNEFIEKQREQKFKNKNRVVYLLKQKKHYHKLCLKFKDYDEKIKEALLMFRRKDSIYQITQPELTAAFQLKVSIEAFLANIQKDLPSKGWKAVMEQPMSKNYLTVVQSGMQDQQIMRRFAELEQSLTNPELQKQMINEEMMHSVTRRVGGDKEKDEGKRMIEGPAAYKAEQMRGSRYPFPQG